MRRAALRLDPTSLSPPGIMHQSPQPPVPHPLLSENNKVKKRITVVDISKKRKSAACSEHTVGMAFIQPSLAAPIVHANQNFFRKNSTPQQLITYIQALPPQVIVEGAARLQVYPPTPENLYSMIMQVPPTDVERLNNIKVSFTNINTVRSRSQQYASPPLHQLSPITPLNTTIEQAAPNYSYCDPRYSAPIGVNEFIFGPEQIGRVHANIKIPIQPNSAGHHIVIQSFLSGVNPPTVQWPQTLEIIIKNKKIKSSGLFMFPLIDITPFAPFDEIVVLCNQEPKVFNLIIRYSQFSPIQQLVQRIVNAPPVAEFFNINELCLLCPFTGKKLNNPGKGKQCQHTQSFELDQFIKRAIYQRQSICPICNRSIPFDQLIYSHETKRILDSFVTVNQDMNIYNDGFSQDSNGFGDFAMEDGFM